MKSNSIVFEARQLSCIRDDRVLFANLDFQVNGGQVLLIEGPNGSGKTSLLRILTGLRLPDEGELFWCGSSLEELDSSFYQHIAYVSHGNGLKDDLSVEENLRYARAFGESTLTIDQALEKVGLMGYQDTPVRYLSAGQRRRLALARLLCMKKSLWILDEPFTSLDKKSIATFEQFIQSHVADNGLVVMTSHHDTGLPAEIVQKIEL
ncbi:MAG: cytochrome c biogenesis heme-transporting ATPase CcmA [Methylicorpusculum sp.]|uniref:cytochrome c biogenesis heme-transporting ATPase CcmA n=1 Tax=Methylicorpusculum sp. TaxID=2713644 RepID=UPI002725B1AF|nr:cytochrome c biogenesis heme-transporting ATPase CcmA [Methylicorpusculum sp.]MDO8939721.1 cytochrome c biogenesis heme-transporting ATPase CcmA [Methylicorpusculum sp.]MDO9241373.1 cytochrome c biogenesis heme-transporting ATPase CcmA [Methylicorpusculum sp.]MDP2204595.1 cytochrome c biogenesis heme-transporting ATPase CcmA [Methylicorpusculum sp.]